MQHFGPAAVFHNRRRASSWCVYDPAPHGSPTSANEAIVASGIGAEPLR